MRRKAEITAICCMPTRKFMTKRGYEEPAVSHFCIFLPTSMARLRELIELFTRRNVHLVALNLLEAVDAESVRAIFSDADTARDILKEADYAFTETDVLAVELPSTDSLADIVAVLLTAEVRMHMAYPLFSTTRGNSIVAVHVEDLPLAARVLKAQGFRLLDEGDLWPAAA
jgi:hypothetical protein